MIEIGRTLHQEIELVLNLILIPIKRCKVLCLEYLIWPTHNLEHLMQNPGRVFSRPQLLDTVWGRDIYVDERTVDVHVGRLRKSLSRGREHDPIRTVRGMGYAFDERFGRSAGQP